MNNVINIPPALKAEWPDSAAVRAELFGLYEAHTGIKLSSPTPSHKEEEGVVAWLNQNAETFAVYFHRKRQILVPAFSVSLSSKVNALAQLHCPVCATKDGLFPIKTLPIRISPVSKQAISQQPKRRAAFERAIRHWFKGATPFSSDKSICLQIVFVVRAKGPQKDLDNMAKAIIDAVKKVLFGDDRQIDHLNVIRIKSPEEEYVYLNIRETLLNAHSDVLVPRLLHSWGGAQPLNLEDFL